MATETAASLLKVLRDTQVLGASQAQELEADPALAGADSRALLRETVKRGWLTPYQANRIARGEAKDLHLGPYLLLDRVGEGGMGAVFRARHLLMNRVVALKVIRTERLANPEAVRRFRREIQAAAQLSHPNIVHAYDAAQVGETHFFVMEYVEGTDLAQLVNKGAPLAVPEACDYIRQAALGLQHAHDKGMVHRDIKPSNLMRTRDGVIKVLDMGLARLQPTADQPGDNTSQLTVEGAVMGTPDYMAPEQAIDSHKTDIRCDIYSLGCTLYFLLTGKPPFSGGSYAQKIAWHMHAVPPDVTLTRPEVPPELTAVLNRMLAKNPDERYSEPSDLARALEPFIPGTVRLSFALPERPQNIAAMPTVIVPMAGTGEERTRETEADTPPLAQPLGPPMAAPLTGFRANVPLAQPVTATPPPPPAGPHTPFPAAPPKPDRRRLYAIAGGVGTALLALVIWLVFLRGGGEPTPPDEKKPPPLPPNPKYPHELVGVLGEERARHWAAARAVAFKNDAREKEVATGSEDGMISLWNPDDLQERKSFRGHPGAVVSLAYSPDGQHLASAGSDGSFRLWRLADLSKEERSFAGVNTPTEVSFSRDGKTVACVSSSQSLRRFNVRSGEEGPSFNQGAGSTLLWFDEIGVLVIRGDAPQSMEFDHWDPKTNKSLQVFKGHTGVVRHAVLSRKTRRVLSSGDDAIRLWDAEGMPVPSFEPLKTPASRLVVSPGGDRFAACVANVGVIVWDAASGAEVCRFPGHVGDVTAVVLPADGAHAFSTGLDRIVRRWALKDGQETPPLQGHSHYVQCVAFSPDGKRLVSGGMDQLARLWDWQGRKELRRWGEGDAKLTQGVRWVTFSGKGEEVLTYDGANKVTRWDTAEDGRNKLTFAPPTPCYQGWALSAGGNELLLPVSTQIDVLNASTLTKTTHLAGPGGHSAPVLCVASSPDGKLLASGGSDNVPILWERATAQAKRRFGGHSGAVRALLFRPDGQALYSAADDSTLCEWDLTASRPRKQLDLEGGLPANLTAIFFSPDAKLLACSTNDGHIVVWDTATGERRFKDWKKLPGGVLHLAWSPDSRYLATANANGTIWVFDLRP